MFEKEKEVVSSQCNKIGSQGQCNKIGSQGNKIGGQCNKIGAQWNKIGGQWNQNKLGCLLGFGAESAEFEIYICFFLLRSGECRIWRKEEKKHIYILFYFPQNYWPLLCSVILHSRKDSLRFTSVQCMLDSFIVSILHRTLDLDYCNFNMPMGFFYSMTVSMGEYVSVMHLYGFVSLLLYFW